VTGGVATRIAPDRDTCDDRAVRTRVLIADDHPGFRARARALLESEGFEVVGEAGDGATAVAMARALDPDLVLLDVQLPDMDGFEAAARMSANGSRPNVVLTSSRDAADFGTRAWSCGARGFVPKAELSAARLLELLG
jgi:DNA-binding NarL/FixJ family response regulator